MPRNDDDFDDDDRPRRRRRDEDDDDERPSRSRRGRDEDDDDRPARSRRRRDNDRPQRRKKKSSLPLVLGIVGGVLFLCCGGGGFAVWYFSDKVGGDFREKQVSNNNMREIGLGFHNHMDQKGWLPNNSYDKNGKPLLSWRVHLLPYLNENALYGQFKLDEPWDSPNNKRLLGQMPRVYSTPEASKRAGEGKTYYRGFSHQGAVFQRPLPGQPPMQLNFTNITDGLTNTILIVEAGEAVEWTRPDDIDWSPGRPMPPLGAGRAGDQVLVLMADGSVRFFRKTMAEANWRGLITYNGNELVAPD